jgi:acylpyruvate hydrolase
MQLFSYLSKGQVRSARLDHGLGIDLALSAESFLKEHKRSENLLDGSPTSLIDLFLPGEGMQLVKESTDWIIKFLPESTEEFKRSGLVFEFNKAIHMAPMPRPGKVICIAGNFPAPNKLDKPEYPIVFLKPSGGVIGNQQSIVIPAVAENVVYEVELAVMIGKRGKNLSTQEAVSVIAGYTIANDLGDRVLEKRTSQWTSGKMFDTFTPMGPTLITPDELRDTSNLNMFTKVNGKFVQKGNTSQMFFDIPYLISYLSTLTTLEPGDVILTGSPKFMDGEPNPSGVLKPDDIVEVGIEKLTSLLNPIISENQVAR